MKPQFFLLFIFAFATIQGQSARCATRTLAGTQSLYLSGSDENVNWYFSAWEGFTNGSEYPTEATYYYYEASTLNNVYRSASWESRGPGSSRQVTGGRNPKDGD